jgi:hypothetical protein
MRGSQAGTDFHYEYKYRSSGGVLSRGLRKKIWFINGKKGNSQGRRECH